MQCSYMTSPLRGSFGKLDRALSSISVINFVRREKWPELRIYASFSAVASGFSDWSGALKKQD